jgi:hypothetical protein
MISAKSLTSGNFQPHARRRQVVLGLRIKQPAGREARSGGREDNDQRAAEFAVQVDAGGAGV